MPNRGSWVEINLAYLRHNITQIQNRSQARLILPVKADAYGHGAVAVAKTAVECGVDFFCVANIGEAAALRENWITQKILLIVPLTVEDCPKVLDLELRPTICNTDVAYYLAELARKRNKIVKVHLEIDTGMSRGGVWYENFIEFFQTIVNIPELQIEGLYTHFASADEGDLFFTQEQQRRFQEILDLKPVMSCKSVLVHFHHIAKGRSVSYNRKYFAKRDTKVGVIDIGYADGFNRKLSNCGQVIIRGKKAPVIGTVCMDMTMIDITDIPEAAISDEVIIVGNQGNEWISADHIAKTINTINYEVLTLFGTLNKREILNKT